MTQKISITPLKGVRGVIARSLSQAWQAPRVAMGKEADMSAVKQRLVQLNKGSDTKLTVTHVVMKAVAECLQQHPALNGVISGDEIACWQEVNLAVAVDTQAGVVAPVINDATSMTLQQLAVTLKELASSARSGKLGPSSFQKGTFTISALGTMGIDWFTPVLNPPQLAILGIGAMQDRVIAVDGQPCVRPTMTLSLVFDHRAVDGVPAGHFLTALAKHLESAEF